MQRIQLWKLVVIGVIAMVFTAALLVVWNVALASYWSTGDLAAATGLHFWLLVAAGDLLLVSIAGAVVWMFVSSLRQARALRRQHTFLDSVTHELKSPLTSLRLCVDTMLKRDVATDLRQRFCEMMQADLDRLHTFIENVLEAGRLRHNERQLSAEEVDLPDLLGQCREQIARRHRVSSDAIALHVSPPDGHVRTDRIALEVILLNLLDNAVKYHGETALQVEVRASVEAAALTLSVRDNGVGIAPGKLRKVFRRFYRTGPAQRVRGTGLGLAVTASLVRRLGGRVRASSTGEGQGATFTVVLPAIAQEAAS